MLQSRTSRSILLSYFFSERVYPQTTSRQRNISERYIKHLGSRRQGAQDILSKFVSTGETLSRPQNTLLRCRAVSVLYTLRSRQTRRSFGRIFLEGKSSRDRLSMRTYPIFKLTSGCLFFLFHFTLGKRISGREQRRLHTHSATFPTTRLRQTSDSVQLRTQQNRTDSR